MRLIALPKETFPEADIHDPDPKPRREARRSAHTRKPRKHRAGARVDSHVGEKGEGGAGEDCDVWES